MEPIPDVPPKKKKPLQQSVSYDDTNRILEYEVNNQILINIQKQGKDFKSSVSNSKLSSDLLSRGSGSVASQDNDDSSQFSKISALYATAQKKKKGNKIFRPFKPVKSYPAAQPRYLAGTKSTQNPKSTDATKGPNGSLVNEGSISSKSQIQRKRFFLTDNDSRGGSVSGANSVSSLPSAHFGIVRKPNSHLRSSSSSVLRKNKGGKETTEKRTKEGVGVVAMRQGQKKKLDTARKEAQHPLVAQQQKKRQFVVFETPSETTTTTTTKAAALAVYAETEEAFHKKFSKYNMMKNVLPEAAVRQKMTVDGFYHEEIQQFLSGTITSSGQGDSPDQQKPSQPPQPPIAVDCTKTKTKTKTKKRMRPGLVVLLTAESSQGQGQVRTEFELPANSSAEEKDSRSNAISSSFTKLLHVLRRSDLADPLHKIADRDIPAVLAATEAIATKPAPVAVKEITRPQADGGEEEQSRVVDAPRPTSGATQRPEAEAEAEAEYYEEEFEADVDGDSAEPPPAADEPSVAPGASAQREKAESSGLLDPSRSDQSSRNNNHDNSNDIIDKEKGRGDFIPGGAITANPISDDPQDDYDDDYSFDSDDEQEQEQDGKPVSSKRSPKRTDPVASGGDRGQELGIIQMQNSRPDLLLAAAAEGAPLERLKLLSREIRSLSRGGGGGGGPGSQQQPPPLSSSLREQSVHSRSRARSQSRGIRGKRGGGDSDERLGQGSNALGFGFDEAVVTSKEQIGEDAEGLVLTKSWKSGQHVANAKFIIFSDAIS